MGKLMRSIVVAIALLLLPVYLFPVDYTWDAGVTGLWSDGINWTPNAPFPGPVAGDTVTISSGTCQFDNFADGTQVDAMTVSGTGNLVSFGGDYLVTVTGDVDLSGTGSFSGGANTLTVIMSASAANATLTSTISGGMQGNLEINAANTVFLGSDVTIGGYLEVQGGTLDTSGSDFDITTGSYVDLSGGTFNANSSIISVDGNYTKGGGTFNVGTSTVIMTSTSSLSTDGYPGTPDFYNLEITGGDTVDIAAAATGIYTTNSCDIDGALNLNNKGLFVGGILSGAGTLTAAGAESIEVQDDFTVTSFTAANSSVTLTGGNAASLGGLTFHDLEINKAALGNTVTSTGGLTVTGDLALTRGTWNADNDTHTIEDDWDSSGANFTFNADTSTISLQTVANPAITTKGTGTDPFYDLTINNGAVLASNIDVNHDLRILGGTLDVTITDYQINVARNWINSGGFTARNGRVVFDSGSTAFIDGNTTFYEFFCTTAGKTLQFDAGNTQSIANGGEFRITGAAGNLITLESDAATFQWDIDVDGGATATVSFASVRDSDASPGATIVPSFTSDFGNNNNWDFATNAQTVTWDGSGGTDWYTASSWDLGYIPTGFDDAVIPNVGNDPVLTADVSINDVDITNGILDLAGFDITAGGDIGISAGGTLRLEGAESVTSATTSFANGTVEYYGTIAYAAPLAAGYTYDDLSFTGAGGSWTLDANLTVNGDLAISDATAILDVVGFDATVTGTTNIAGTVRRTGAAAQTVAQDDDGGAPDSGTVIYYGNVGGADIEEYGATDYWNLEIDSAAANTFSQTSDIAVANTLTITNGTLETDANSLAANAAVVDDTLDTTGQLAGDSIGVTTDLTGTGTVSSGAGLTDIDGAASVADFDAGAGGMDVEGTVSIADLTVTAANTINIGGDFTSASFTPLTGLVVLDVAGGSAVTVTGYNDLTIDDDITQAADWTVGGTLTVTGGDTLTTGANSLSANAAVVDGTLVATGQGGTETLAVTTNLSGTGTVSSGGGLVDIDGDASVADFDAGAGGMDVEGTVSIADLSVTAANTINIGGDFTSASFTPAGGLVVLDVANTSTVTVTGYNDVTIDDDIDQAADWTVAGTLTVTGGNTLTTVANSLSANAAVVNGTLDATGQGGAETLAVTTDLSGTGAVAGGGGLLDINGNASVTTLTGAAGNIDIDGDVSITNLTASTGNTNIGGDFTTPTATFFPNNGTLILDINNSSNVTVDDYFNLTVSDSIATGGAWTVNNDLLISGGIVLDVAGFNLSVTGTTNILGTLRRTGPAGQLVAQDDDAAAPNSGTVIYYGNVAGAEVQDYGATDYYNFQVNSTTDNTFDLSANLDIANNCTITQGTLDVADLDLTVANTTNILGTVRRTGLSTQSVAQDDNAGAPNSGTVIYYGNAVPAEIEEYGGTDYFDLEINGNPGNTYTLTDNLGVANDCTISNGIVDAVDFDLTVAGTFQNARTLRRTGAGGQTVERDNDSGLVVYYGAAGAPIQDYGAGNDYWNLEIEGTGTFTIAATLETGNDITISGGALSAGGFQIVLAGSWNNTGGVFTHGNGLVVFDGGGNESLLSNAQAFWNLEIDKNAANSVTILDDLYVDHDLTITQGNFNGNTSGLTIYMNANGVPVWDNDGSKTGLGDFVPGDSRVVVGDSMDFLGSTTFWEFRFQIAAGNPTLRFEDGETQTFVGTAIDAVRIEGVDNLNRITLASTTPGNQWNIDLQSASIIFWCRVQDSNACVGPTITPGEIISLGNNTCWSISIVITSFNTRDADADGRIDCIELVAPDNLNDEFFGLTVDVAGYTVTSIATLDPVGGGAANDPSFYLWLEEKTYLDTGATPGWRITANVDPDGGGPLEKLRALTGGAEVESNPVYQTPDDGADPTIGYTLTAAGSTRTFIHFSEYVYGDAGATTAIDDGDFAYAGAANPIAGGVNRLTTDGVGTRDLFLDYSIPVTGGEIVALTNLTATVWDQAGNPATPAAHNISDIGLNIIQPVWAVNMDATFTTEITTRDPLRGGIGRITRFDGSEQAWLQDANILLQARVLDPGLVAAITPLRIHFDDAPDFPIRISDMWVPDPPPATLAVGSGTDDLLHKHPLSQNGGSANVLGTNMGGGLFNFELDASAASAQIFNGSDLEFLFVTDDGLPCARIPNPDDPRTAEPYMIHIRELRGRRGEVAVSNNVINPTRGETVKVTYTIAQTGMVTINVFDLKGDIVDVLYRGQRTAGEYSTTWDGRNRGNRVVARGVYFIKVVGPGISEIRKVLVVK